MTRTIAALVCAAAVVTSGAAGSPRVTVTTSVGPARLLSPAFGYAVVSRTVSSNSSVETTLHLYLYDHGWREATPPLGRDVNDIEDVSFVDPRHGWVAAYDCANVSVYVYRTSDGGRSWRSQGRPGYHSCGGGPSYLSFSDRRHGWLEPVSPNAPGAELLRTVDGGRTWKSIAATDSLPCLAPIAFRSALLGWMSRCSPSWRGSGVFTTRDGGAHWRRVRTGRATRFFDLPHFFGRTGAMAALDVRGITFFASSNGGRTWSLRARRTVGGCRLHLDRFERGTAWPEAVAGAQIWWIVTGLRATVQLTHDGGSTWRSGVARGLPAGCAVTYLAAVDASRAWATAKNGNGTELYETHDGGRNWQRALLPTR
jgi:photosystem II stability/assembly factor-like uncharacterized protein